MNKNDYGSLVSKLGDRSFLLTLGLCFGIYQMAAAHEIPFPLAAILITVKVGVFVLSEKYKDSVYLSTLRSVDTVLSAELPASPKVSLSLQEREKTIAGGFAGGFHPAGMPVRAPENLAPEGAFTPEVTK